MNKDIILDSIKKLREISPKRNFEQSFDVCINLSNLNPKKTEDRVDVFVHLPHNRGKKVKICAEAEASYIPSEGLYTQFNFLLLYDIRTRS